MEPFLTVDELVFIGIIFVMVFGIGSAPGVVRRLMSLPTHRG